MATDGRKHLGVWALPDPGPRGQNIVFDSLARLGAHSYLRPTSGRFLHNRRFQLEWQLAREYLWVARCGSTLEGYIEHYGSKDDPDHYGDGGELIYAADIAKINALREELDMKK